MLSVRLLSNHSHDVISVWKQVPLWWWTSKTRPLNQLFPKSILLVYCSNIALLFVKLHNSNNSIIAHLHTKKWLQRERWGFRSGRRSLRATLYVEQVYNKGCIAIIIQTSFAAFSSSPVSRTNATEFSNNSWYTRSSRGTRRSAT